MKQLKTTGATYGPFNFIEETSDRYVCDGTEYPFNVIGEATIEEWVAIPFVPPKIVPQSVSPRQIRQALTKMSLRTKVETQVSISNQDTKDWYEFSTEFRRDNPVVATLASVLKVSDEALDDLWILADSL